jgi:hypothetical protein
LIHRGCKLGRATADNREDFADDTERIDPVTDQAQPAPSLTAGKTKQSKAVVAVVVAACIVTFLAVIFTWVRGQALNTDRYVQTVAPLASNHAIQDALTNAINKQLDTQLHPEQMIRDALPAKAAPIAGPLSAAITGFAHEAVGKFIHSDLFKKIWTEISRLSHAQVVNVLTGKKVRGVAIRTDGTVRLDIAPLVGPLKAALSKAGIQSQQLNSSSDGIILLDAPQLKNAQGAVKLLKGFTLLFQILAPLLFLIAIWLSKVRRRTVITVGLSLAGTMAFTGILLALGRYFYLDSLPSRVPNDASAAFFDTLLRYLTQAVRLIAATGLLIALAAWFTGSGQAAVDDAKGAGLVPLLRVAIIGIGSILLLTISHPTAITILLVIAITALLAALTGPVVERARS